MPKCTADKLEFGRIKRQLITANFEGSVLSSDDGLMLLRQVDQKIALSAAVAAVVHDPRNPDLVTYSLRELIVQRLYALACGYEDLNDHAQLRTDPLMQTAVGRSKELGSSPTLPRLETRVRRSDLVALNQVLVDQFMASHSQPSDELILGIDAADIPPAWEPGTDGIPRPLRPPLLPALVRVLR